MLDLDRLRINVTSGRYVVDAHAVADALLIHAGITSGTPAEDAAARTAPDDGLSATGADTRPVRSQRRPAAEAHAARPGENLAHASQPVDPCRGVVVDADAQLEVLAAGHRELCGVHAELRRDVGDAGGDRHAVEIDRRAAPRCARRGARASVARPSERSISARAAAPASARPASSRGSGPQVRATSAESPRARPSRIASPAAAAPSVPVTPTRSPAPRTVAADERPRRDRPSPTTVTAIISAGARTRSPPAIVVPVRAASCSIASASASTSAGADVRRDAECDVGLAGLGAHRREIRQRGRERAVPDVRGGRPRRVEPEVDALDHRVDARDGERGGRARRRRRPRPSARSRSERGAHQPLEGGDQLELTGGRMFRAAVDIAATRGL